MSNLGQAALIIVGTVVGSYFGSPQLGFVLGSLAGNALFPTQLPGQSGPRMSDNQTTTSVVGMPVPILFGTAAVSGTFMWLDQINQITNVQTSGKGGPTQTNTTFSYMQSVAVGLCEGPIAGMSRVWENGMLVYDIRPQLASEESDTDYANRLTVAAAYAETFTLHLGGEDQMPDATIEAVEGMGDVPAFRGLAYIVYPNRMLVESQALRHPSFKFEIFESGGGNCTTSNELSNDVLFEWNFNDGSSSPTNPLNNHFFRILTIDNAAPGSPLDSSVTYTSLNDTLGVVSGAYGFPVDTFLTYGIGPADDGENLVQITASVNGGGQSAVNLRSVQLHFGTKTPGYKDPITGLGPFFAPSGADGPIGSIWWQGSEVLEAMPFGSATLPGFLTTTNGPIHTYSVLKDAIIRAYRLPSPPGDPCYGLPTAPLAGYAIRSDGKYIRCGGWTLDTTNSYNVLQQSPGSGPAGNSIIHPLNPCIPTGSANDNSTFWTAAYNAAVAAGTMPSGYTYATEYPKQQNRGWTLDLQVCDGAGAQVSIGHIIRTIAARCGLTSVDASDMDAVFVDGYAISSVSAARDILTPLRSVGFFDCVESGDTLKFVARGKPIVTSLSSDDFGAFDAGATGGAPGPAITTTKAQDADLPLQTRVHYFATSRDYEAGEQLSPTRLTTTAVNVVDVELAVCMSDTQAAKIADVIWSDAWAERWGGTLAVDQAQSQLEPGDCLEVPVDGVTRRIRIINETVASGVLRTLNYVRDDDGAYVSHAVAAAPARLPQQLRFLSATDLEMLDLPALTDADDNAGIYAAARGSLSGNAWNGAVIFRSADSGATFAQLGAVTTAAAMGTLHAAVAPSDWHTWDDVTMIIVDVPTAVTFESRTDAAVLTGANAAAMGRTGRWEIVQFANATQLSSTQWQLSRLLRGRRGTEHNISSSLLGDKFVMISTGALIRLPLQVSEIGANRVYKAVSIGASYSSGLDQTFAGQGMALRPFSPVFLTAERGSAGDILLSWTRRGRLSRTLMSGVDMPLSEVTESYSVDIYTPDTPHTVVRVLASTTQHVTYTGAQQSADFGSDSATHIMVAVYQISATVGRGTPDVQTLTIT